MDVGAVGTVTLDAALPNDDLYASTCSWLDGASGVEGAGPVLLAVTIVVATMVLWRMLRGTTKAPDNLGKKVRLVPTRLTLISEDRILTMRVLAGGGRKEHARGDHGARAAESPQT